MSPHPIPHIARSSCRDTAISPAGFTLIELLVVIGIVAMLISILLPTLNRARETANMIACSSNLRQLAMAAHLYVSDNRGYLPPILTQVDSSATTPSMTTFSNPGTGVYGLFDKYGIKPRSTVRVCPSVLSARGNVTASDLIFSYAYNSVLGGMFPSYASPPVNGPVLIGGTLVARPYQLANCRPLGTSTFLFTDSNQIKIYEQDWAAYFVRPEPSPFWGTSYYPGGPGKYHGQIETSLVHRVKDLGATGWVGVAGGHVKQGINNIAYTDGSVRPCLITYWLANRTPWPGTTIDPADPYPPGE